MNFILYFVILLYMELVYHFVSFGVGFFNPMFMIASILTISGVMAVLSNMWQEKVNRKVTWLFLGISYFFFAAQVVYVHVFSQPLLFMAAKAGGKDALTNYWREVFVWIGQCWFGLLMLAIPLIAYGVLVYQDILIQKNMDIRKRLLYIAIATIGVGMHVAILFYGKTQKLDYFEAYSEFYSPIDVTKEYGIITAFQRGCTGSLFEANDDFEYSDDLLADLEGNSEENTDQLEEEKDQVPETTIPTESSEPEEVVYEAQHMDIDFVKLLELCQENDLENTLQYFSKSTTTMTNEYTGMFEGYNLIYLTAEGFSPYAVDETLTPTLYKLINGGFHFTDFYVPLWQTSTSDGEYVNLTGQIPDQQFSLRRSADTVMPFTLAKYFGERNYTTNGYHNNTLSYYERERTHTNIGYNFRASKLGDLDPAQWGNHIFTMEKPNEWPASDYNMMVATIPEYINDDAFHIYYMTVSGHMNYSFSGNKMSANNKEAVANLPYGEEARAYIACHIELDKALQYLIEQLESAGKLENTVICMAADHYPYGMKEESFAEISGQPVQNHDVYKSNLILWNSEMETVVVDKACCSVDITPTLLNLFGFDYDSRIYAGKDILSDSEGLVIFSDRSYITDKVEYVKDGKQIIPRSEEEVTEEYIEQITKLVRARYWLSSTMLNNDFCKYIQQCLKYN